MSIVEQCIPVADSDGFSLEVNLHLVIFSNYEAPVNVICNRWALHSVTLTQSRTLEDTIAPISRIAAHAIIWYGLIKTLQNQLSLYQAVVLIFLFFISLPRWIPLSKDKFKDYVVAWLSFLGMGIYISWVLFILVRGKDFGPSPECNESTVVVLFWVTISATELWLRIVLMTLFGGMAFFLFFVALIAIMQLWTFGKETPWLHYTGESNASPSNASSLTMATRVIHAGRVLARDAVLISWLELTIKGNGAKSVEFQWNIAHAIVLILLIYEVIMVLNFFLDKVGPTRRMSSKAFMANVVAIERANLLAWRGTQFSPEYQRPPEAPPLLGGAEMRGFGRGDLESGCGLPHHQTHSIVCPRCGLSRILRVFGEPDNMSYSYSYF